MYSGRLSRSEPTSWHAQEKSQRTRQATLAFMQQHAEKSQGKERIQFSHRHVPATPQQPFDAARCPTEKCLEFTVSVCLSVRLSVCLSVCPSVLRPSIRVRPCPSVRARPCASVRARPCPSLPVRPSAIADWAHTNCGRAKTPNVFAVSLVLRRLGVK